MDLLGVITFPVAVQGPVHARLSLTALPRVCLGGPGKSSQRAGAPKNCSHFRAHRRASSSKSAAQAVSSTGRYLTYLGKRMTLRDDGDRRPEFLRIPGASATSSGPSITYGLYDPIAFTKQLRCRIGMTPKKFCKRQPGERREFVRYGEPTKVFEARATRGEHELYRHYIDRSR